MREKIPFWAHRTLAPLTLFLWGAILTYFYCSHRLAALLHPDFHLPVLATGLLLLGAAGCVLFQAKEPAEEEAQACGCNHGEHSHGGMSAGRWLVFLVLLVPITAAAWISPDHYSQVLVQNRRASGAPGNANTALLGGTLPPPLSPQPGQESAPLPVEVGDLLMAAQTASGREQYAGQRVELMGQVCALGQTRFELVRMLMLCCAADAQVLSVRVDGPSDMPSMKWAKVTGQVRFDEKEGREVPVVAAEKVMPVPQPDNPYVYRGGAPVSAPRSDFKIQLPPR